MSEKASQKSPKMANDAQLKELQSKPPVTHSPATKNADGRAKPDVPKKPAP